MDSIEKFILGNPDHVPFRTRNKVFHWAVQIADALCLIHGKELSHQNLKLKNVLVSKYISLASCISDLCCFKTTNSCNINTKFPLLSYV